MDKYDAANDHYCYPKTETLINKLGLTNIDDLEEAEREITEITARIIRYSPPPYNLSNMQHLHFQLFSNLYNWAGEIRTIDISKGGTRFCTCSRIEAESKKIFDALEKDKWLKGLSKNKFCEKLAEHYCELNMIHPFREGNGRVQRLLFEHLSLSAGYDLDWGNITQTEWIQANIDGVNVNYKPMTEIFKRIVSSVE